MATIRTSMVIAVLLAAAASGRADQPAAKPAIEPGAIAALQAMGNFLRSQQSFTVHATTSTDYVMDSGQKVRLSARGELRVRRPDHMRADIVSDRKQRQFFYDGKTFTMYGPSLGYYATVNAPPTLIQLADLLSDRYGLQLPLVDLFRWGTQESDVRDITAAFYVGPANVDGVQTDQYAFRQPGLDWQIWIERGPRPLPRRVVLTTTDVPARPEHAIELTWDLGVQHTDQDFVFVPAKDSKRIELAEIGPPRVEQARPARRGLHR
jgi:hypothetical protein